MPQNSNHRKDAVFQSMLQQYARLIAVSGVNIQKDQGAVISCPVEQYEFATMVMEECYRAGAGWVRMEWSSQAQDKLHNRYKTLQELSRLTSVEEAEWKETADVLPAMINIISDNPKGLEGIDQAKAAEARKERLKLIRPYRKLTQNRIQWTIVAVPCPEWAMQVFPGLPEDEAVSRMWEAILAACRVTPDNDPVAAWISHNENFAARCAWLNDRHFDRLTYKSSNGTDFSVGLIPQGMWCGGGEETIGGTFFNPNMPTEEIFTSPMRGQAEGTLVSTKPLSCMGQLIENFSITFHDGKAVSWHAEKGQETLDHLLATDENAAYLGEVALIPCDSPINNTGILFYETLFDENASCHVALGAGFNDCIRGYQHLTDEECKAMGVNDSVIHVDFMIGAPDLCITGWKDGAPTPVFVNGGWAE